jgi:uncharacterized repeat protein (TIGR03847 family)
MDIDPQTFTADYVGEPGQRTFYVQSRGGGQTLSYVLEKQQVAALADRLRDLLVLIDDKDTVRSAAPERDPALEIEQPVEPEWRVGTMGLGYEEDADRIIVVLQRADAEDEEAVDLDEAGIRFRLRRDQARAFILHALAVVQEGRPICQLCGLPMSPSGHQCPAANGHHLTA